MKRILSIAILVLTISCTSTRFVDSWKNSAIPIFEPQKLVVIGMTDNLTAQKIFEENLKNAFIDRGVNAYESSVVLDQSFTESQRSENEIEIMKEKLLRDGFDAVAITAVIGVDNKTDYSSRHYTFGYDWYRFGRYYYRFQRVYYTPNYYNDYKIYHVETSIYNLKEDEDKSLVWVGTFDVVNPQTITATVKDHVARIMTQLEREGVLQKGNRLQ